MLSRLSDRSRQRLRTITVILATALIIAPAAALAGHQFNDVPNSNVFHDDIEWMRANGVTAGCNPPANDEYCPDDNVTREQMAAFMHRLETENVFVRPGQDAVDGGNADTVDGMHAADFLGANQKAVDSDKLDGKHASDFLGANQTAVDSDKLDGFNASDFGSTFIEDTRANTVAIVDSCANYTSITVTTPTAGVIDVRGEVNIRVAHTQGQEDDAQIFISDVSGTTCSRDGLMINSLQVPSPWPSGDMETTLPISDFFEVGAGTHTFWLNGQAQQTGTSAYFWYSRLQATFHPMASGS